MQDRPQIEVMTAQMEQNDPEKGSFLLNLYQRRAALEVRAGLGQQGQFGSTLVGLGYQEILGNTILWTDFSHLQILTVLRCTAMVQDVVGQTTPQSVYCLSVLDLTSNTRWEEVLHRHTAENSTLVTPLPVQRPAYQTNLDDAFAGFPQATTGMVTFAEYQDTIVFGNPQMGTWAYLPSSFGGQRTQQIDTMRKRPYGSPYGESSRCIRMAPAPNPLYTSNTSYLDNAAFPSPTCITVANNRLCYSAGRSIYFSDIGAPASIAALNFITLASDQDVVAIAETQGVIWIFTPFETYVYQPSQSFLASQGRLTQLSATVGCLNPRSLVLADDRLVWASSSGIYRSNGLSIERVSDPIKPLFDEGLTAPLGNYFQSNGITPNAGDKPTLLYGWDVEDAITLTYEPLQKLLIVTVPAQRYCLVLQGDNWSMWSLESVCTVSGAVGITENIQNPQFLTMSGQLFCVGGVEQNDGVGSYYVLEWGRGGALDRSVSALDDTRAIDCAGQYQTTQVGTGMMLLDRPVPVQAGYVLPEDTEMLQGGILVPLKLAPYDGSTAPQALKAAFLFNNQEWRPMCRAGTATIDIVIPADRLPSRKGWGIASLSVGVAEVRVYNSGTGLADADGDEIRLYWSGAYGASVTDWSFSPYMNVSPRNLSTLLMVPFEQKVVHPATDLNIGWTVAKQESGHGLTDVGYGAWTWQPIQGHDLDDVAQPVDYLFRTPQMKDDKDGQQLRARGMMLRVLTHAQGIQPLFPNWLHGLLNINLGSDWKDWTSQIVDYQGDIQQASETTNRLRVRDSNGLMQNRTLEGTLKWGEDNQGSIGNYLVDEEEVDTVAVSDSVKGESLSFTVFGHMRDRAARLVFDSIRVLVEKTGSPRRRGR